MPRSPTIGRRHPEHGEMIMGTKSGLESGLVAVLGAIAVLIAGTFLEGSGR